MAAGRYDATVERGARFSDTLTWRDAAGAAVDLTGRTVRWLIGDAASAAATLDVALPDGDAAGTISLLLTEAQTGGLPRRAYWHEVVVDETATGETEVLVSGLLHVRDSLL